MSSPRRRADPEKQYARTRCVWPPAVTSKRYGSRVTIVMRSEERMDRVFGRDWQRTEIGPTGRVQATDLNVPISNLTSYGTAMDLKKNPPITVMGKYKAILTARAVQNRNLAPRHIICSPALRSVETASAVAGFFKIKLCIEPGLSDHPTGSVDYGLAVLTDMFNVDMEYEPIVPWSSLSMTEKTPEEVRNRVQQTLKALMQKEHSRPLFIVAHGLVQQTLSQLADGQPIEEHGSLPPGGEETSPIELGLRYPPGSVLTAVRSTEQPPHSYSIVGNLIPPLSYGPTFSNAPIPH